MNNNEYHKIEIDHEHLRTLTLTRNESLYIDDSLSLLIEKEAFGEQRIGTMRLQLLSAPLGAPIDLIEKITYAVLYTTDKANQGRDANIEVTDEELFILREIAQSYIKIGDEPVGYNLKRKIYTLIHADYTSDAEWEQVLRPFDSQNQRRTNILNERNRKGK